MRRSFAKVLLLIGVLLVAQPAVAQTGAPPPTPSEESMKAARELVTMIRNLAADVRALLPSLVQGLKPAIVQNRPEVARDYDAMLPMVIETVVGPRTNEINEIYAVAYARNFTVPELQDIAAFYRTDTGKKVLAKHSV